MAFYSIASERGIYEDDFVGQWGGQYQGLNTGSINRLWRAIAGRDGVLELQANNGYNVIRHSPNSLYLDTRTLRLEAELATVRNTGIQQFYIGLSDKHLGELPILNGVVMVGSTADNLWRAQSYKGGVMVDTGVIGSLSNNVFHNVKIKAGDSGAVVSLDGVELPLAFTGGYAAGLMIGLNNNTASWPSLLIDWVKIGR